jgi:nicotinate-nucleotide adenylyltransferase
LTATNRPGPQAVQSRASRRIGVLGGTFDPVHIGHLRGAVEVAEALGLDELRLVPSARPPHRDQPQVSAEQRLAMVRAAVEGLAPLTVDDRELARDKPSYTLDTLVSMRAELDPQDQLLLLLGCLLWLAHLVSLGRTAATLPYRRVAAT